MNSHDNAKENSQPDEEFKFSEKPTLEDLRAVQTEFCNERDWNKYHTPRNLLLALVGEVGELSEIFQWKNECKQDVKDWSIKEKEALSHELSDVLIYLLRLAQVCEIDLPKEALKKIELNKLKYPTHKCYGSDKKYNQYE